MSSSQKFHNTELLRSRINCLPSNQQADQVKFQTDNTSKAKRKKQSKAAYVLRPDQRYSNESCRNNPHSNPYIFLPHYLVHAAEPKRYNVTIARHKNLNEIALDTAAGYTFREHNTGKSSYKGGGFSFGKGNYISGERAVKEGISRRQVPCTAGSDDAMSRTVLGACRKTFTHREISKAKEISSFAGRIYSYHLNSGLEDEKNRSLERKAENVDSSEENKEYGSTGLSVKKKDKKFQGKSTKTSKYYYMVGQGYSKG